ncbi:MAG: hypothetical protein ACI39U_08910 [Candidatus Cryptobacteroides sp.]
MSVPALAQETLSPAKIQARGARKHPSLGLTQRLDGRTDPAVWYDAGSWYGADSLNARPFWTMDKVSEPTDKEKLMPVSDFCVTWASEKPEAAVDIVYGPYRRGWYFAICKKIDDGLGWKSIAFVIPEDGIQDGKRIWDYSLSVNLLEYFIGYNLFPGLPRNLQERIEEMTAYEHLCSFQEYDLSPLYEPDYESDRDWEDDLREIM